MDVEDFIYSSYGRARPYIPNLTDDFVRKPEFAKQLLQLLNHPEAGIPMILVTGSKGKGSVSRMIAFLLEQLGYRVGHFSSPHLLEYAERIRVNGKAISDSDLKRLTLKIMPFVDKLEVQAELGEYISPIALGQAIAMLYFQEQAVDVAVIEAGRGGRFDDTNQLPHQTAVITALMEEHLDQLGPTIDQVIWHKLGIINEGVNRVYIGKQNADVLMKVDQQIEEQTSVQVFHYGRDFAADQIQISLSGTQTNILSRNTHLDGIMLPLLGKFQAHNFALAFTVVNDWTEGAAAKVDWSLHLPALRWPGRCEVIGQAPLVLLDGAVHRSSAEQIRDVLQAIHYSRLHVVLSIPKDKDVDGVVEVWSEAANLLITTTTTNPYLDYDYAYTQLLAGYGSKARHIEQVEQALELAREGLDGQGVLLLMGTQSFVADIKRLWGESVRDL